MEQQIAELVGGTLLQSLKEEERRVDETLHQLDKMDEDDFERLREKRLQQMKNQAKQNQEWKTRGHGAYTELTDQHAFFEATKQSKHVLIHFYTPTNKYCTILDKHFEALAPKHMEARFCKMNGEKAEFLVNKLGIWMIPTIVLCRDREVADLVPGFDAFGGVEDFSTSYLEYFLSTKKMIKYDGPVPESYQDEANPAEKNTIFEKSKIRQSKYHDSDED